MDEDRNLEEAVRKALAYDRRLSSQPIEVSVKDAIVYLRGTVQSHGRVVAAYEVAASLAGVRKVSNRLVVEPPGNLRDDDVATYVRAALDVHAEVLKEAITVSVSGGVVTLEGSVRDAWQHSIAEDIARSARGVRDVPQSARSRLLTTDQRRGDKLRNSFRDSSCLRSVRGWRQGCCEQSDCCVVWYGGRTADQGTCRAHRTQLRSPQRPQRHRGDAQ